MHFITYLLVLVLLYVILVLMYPKQRIKNPYISTIFSIIIKPYVFIRYGGCGINLLDAGFTLSEIKRYKIHMEDY
jgi:hypothetical protein